MSHHLPGVAAPAQGTPPRGRPPDADPASIRACLTAELRDVFDGEWEHVLDEAKRSKDLAGVRDLLQKWRQFAHQEMREPGTYSRVLATAARIQATGRATAGSVTGDEVRARIDARLRAPGSTS